MHHCLCLRFSPLFHGRLIYMSNSNNIWNAVRCMGYPNNSYSFIDPSDNASNTAIIQLLNLDAGNHYLVLYPNNGIIRKIYAGYIGSKLKENSLEILFFTYYDSPDKVREVLTKHGLDVRNYEKTSLTIVDHAAEFKGDSSGLNGFANKIQDYRKNQKNNLVVIADMSIYTHVKYTEDILNLEKSLPNASGNWKQLCLYHQMDFDRMFTVKQKQSIFDYHKDKTIVI